MEFLRLLAFCLVLAPAVARQGRPFAFHPSRRAAPTPSGPPSGASSLKAAAANEGSIQVARPDGSSHRLSYRIARPVSLSSRQAAPIVALHGGPSVPSGYLYPLEDAVPYRSIVFYDQLGCGKSDEPGDASLYSIEDSVRDLEALLAKLGVRRFHLYGQSYGGILAFEYMKSAASRRGGGGAECLSAILSSAPSNVKEVEEEFERLLQDLPPPGESLEPEELEELFRKTHQCRLPEMPGALADAYAGAGSVWRGTRAIADYVAHPPPDDAARMPSALIMRGEFDFVSQASVDAWRSAFNTKFLRYRTLKGCSHHGLHENGKLYGEIVDSYFSEYD